MSNKVTRCGTLKGQDTVDVVIILVPAVVVVPKTCGPLLRAKVRNKSIQVRGKCVLSYMPWYYCSAFVAIFHARPVSSPSPKKNQVMTACPAKDSSPASPRSSDTSVPTKMTG